METPQTPNWTLKIVSPCKAIKKSDSKKDFVKKEEKGHAWESI